MKELSTKAFTNGFVSVLALEDGRLIETTATCLPLSTEMRGTANTSNIAIDYNNFNEGHWEEKFMIGVSTQSGCPIKCKFCAVNKLTEAKGYRNLTSKEIVAQVEFAINKSGRDPFKAKLFRILFTRMGEPALNASNVILAIKELKLKYPRARIQISTIGVKKLSQKLVNTLIDVQKRFGHQFIELQFSIHSTDDNFRQYLQSNKVVSNITVSEIISQYNKELMNLFGKLDFKVTLNFALAKNTPFEVEGLKNQFSPEDVFIKISPINENVVSKENNIETLFINVNNI